MSSLAQRVRAWIALGAFVGALVLPYVSLKHLTFDDDVACARLDAPLGAGPSQAALQAGSSDVATHCALCHWLRAVSSARIDIALAPATWLEPADVAISTPESSPAAPSLAAGPARAPPSFVS